MSSSGPNPPDDSGQQPGWGQQPPPGGGWGGNAPPPQGQFGYVRPDHPRATTALILGILGLVLCGIAAPFAWRIGKGALDDIDRSQGRVGGRGQAQAGYILGIIGTILLAISVLAFFLIVVLAIGGLATSP